MRGRRTSKGTAPLSGSSGTGSGETKPSGTSATRPLASRGRGSRSARRTVAIVSSDAACRQHLGDALSGVPWEVTVIDDTGDAFNRILALQPACVVIHEMREQGEGVTLFQQLQATSGGPRVVFVTTIRRVSWGADLILSGAVYVLDKPIDGDRLRWAVGAAINQSQERHAIEQELQLLNSRREALSPRESKLLDQMVAGKYATGSLASALGLTKRTVENYRHAIMRTYKCRKMIEVIGLEYRRIDLERRLKSITPLALDSVGPRSSEAPEHHKS